MSVVRFLEMWVLYLMRLLLSEKICPYVVIGYFIYG